MELMATYERKINVEDAHRVTYVNRHGEHVSRIVFDSEVTCQLRSGAITRRLSSPVTGAV